MMGRQYSELTQFRRAQCGGVVLLGTRGSLTHGGVRSTVPDRTVKNTLSPVTGTNRRRGLPWCVHRQSELRR